MAAVTRGPSNYKVHDVYRCGIVSIMLVGGSQRFQEILESTTTCFANPSYVCAQYPGVRNCNHDRLVIPRESLKFRTPNSLIAPQKP